MSKIKRFVSFGHADNYYRDMYRKSINSIEPVKGSEGDSGFAVGKAKLKNGAEIRFYFDVSSQLSGKETSSSLILLAAFGVICLVSFVFGG